MNITAHFASAAARAMGHATALAAISAIGSAALAQQTAPQQVIIVTGNPLGSQELAAPASSLSGTGLLLRRGSSLGETLDGLPGVSASYFGPNANRPVIRGQDGDRIRVLSNAGATLDASSLSFDHAVAIDPLVIERIEVLRGPAALLYGGSAIGGVVNAIDNRIPQRAQQGLSGATEMRAGGAGRERAISALLEGGSTGSGGGGGGGGGIGVAWHVDGFHRRSHDLRVPAFDRPMAQAAPSAEAAAINGPPTERRNHIVNSAGQAQGGAVGASLVGAQGHLGLSLDTYRNRYGIVVEDDITINMRRDKLALAGEWRPPSGYISALRAQAAATDYWHQEIEGNGEVGTTFKTRGADARVELLHRALPAWAAGAVGVLGMQLETARFSALGAEAFVPSTRTHQAAIFMLERWALGERGQISAGLRAEQVRVASAGDPAEQGAAASAQFGPAQQRRFSPRSAAIDGVLHVTSTWQASASLSYTERAPTSYELFANGLHAATQAFERGQPQQAKERGRNIDLGLAWRNGALRVKGGVFDSRFANYIALTPTGNTVQVMDADHGLPEFVFRGVRAHLYGMEAEASWRSVVRGWAIDLDAKLDSVRGQDLDSAQPLPRLAPQRITLAAGLANEQWTGRIEVRRASAQTRVPSADAATPGWTQINLSASCALRLGEHDARLFVKLQNAGNALAYSASAINTVRPLAPLPGRGLTLGLRLGF